MIESIRNWLASRWIAGTLFIGLAVLASVFLQPGFATLHVIPGTRAHTLFALSLSGLVHVVIVITVVHHARKICGVRSWAAR